MATPRTHPLSVRRTAAVYDAARRGRRDLRDLGLVLAVGWAVRAAFIASVPYRVHSADIDRWITVTQQLRAGANPYATTTYLNWPPLWMTILWLLDHVAR